MGRKSSRKRWSKATTTRKDARWEKRRRRILGIALRFSVASRTSDELTVLVGESTTAGSIHVCSPATLLTSASASALSCVRAGVSRFVESLFPKRLLAWAEIALVLGVRVIAHSTTAVRIIRHWQTGEQSGFRASFGKMEPVETQRGVPLRVA